MKKILALLLAITMIAAFCACAQKPADTTPADTSADTASDAPAASDGKLIKVGIINNDPNESGYRTANDKDLKAMFTEENGYDASFAYSLKNDEQIAAAQKFIQDEVDYLLISAAGTSGWDSVLQDAQAAGIQVILFDRTIEKMQKAIQLHSIKKKPARRNASQKEKDFRAREEFNPFLHNAWLMMGRAQYLNGDFLGAASTFFYISPIYIWSRCGTCSTCGSSFSEP